MDEQPEPAVVEQPAPPASKAGAGWVVAGVVVVIALCVIGLIARPRASDGGGEPAPQRASTCSEWAAQPEADRVDQADEMLTNLRRVDGLGAPGPGMSERFAAGVTNVCSANSGWKLSEIAAGLYVTERETFG